MKVCKRTLNSWKSEPSEAISLRMYTIFYVLGKLSLCSGRISLATVLAKKCITEMGVRKLDNDEACYFDFAH